jgi:hypothetical protein
MLEPGSALTLDREVPHEHPHGGDDHSRGVPPIVPTPLLNEIPQPAGCIRPRVVPQDADEVPDIAAVRDQRALDDAPVDAHPSEEPLDPSDGVGASLDWGDAALAEVPEEPANTGEDLSRAIAGRARAPARRSVPLEGDEGLVVDRLERVTLALDPHAEVSDGLTMESGAYLVVPRADEPPFILTKQLVEGLRLDR